MASKEGEQDLKKIDPVCPVKKMMNNCLYTTQGMFVCNVESDEKGKWGMEQNIDMMREASRDKRTFNTTSPWDN